MVDTARRGRLAEYAYDFTKRLLFDGTLSPGAKLRVEDVVAALHTSRQPVMDAFKRLAAEGYLEITPQVGCRVVAPDSAEIADFFLILGAVQGLAAEIAAGRYTASELTELTAVAVALDALLEEQPTLATARECHRLEDRFQQLLRLMAHSDAVSHLSTGLLDRRDFYIACVTDGELRYARRLRQGLGGHQAVVREISAGQAEAARGLLEALIIDNGRFAEDKA